MKPDWQSFLIDNGAEFGEGDWVHFGNPERERRAALKGLVLCDLSDYGLISAHGDDALSFLQGQFSNDINQVNTQTSQLSSYSTPKGRMLALFRVFQIGDTYFLRLPQEILEDTLKRLRMFVMMSKVTLEDASSTLAHFGFSGPDADKELEKELGSAPQNNNQVITYNDDITVIRIAGEHPRFEIYGQLRAAMKLWESLNVRAAPVTREAWAYMDIVNGIPEIKKANVESFVAQMTNLELIGGVSFKKGCFPGQEIVARTKYLGKVKRRMYHVSLPIDESPKPGDELIPDDSGIPNGRIVMTAGNADGGIAALAVLPTKLAEEEHQLSIYDQSFKLSINELPYSLETKD